MSCLSVSVTELLPAAEQLVAYSRARVPCISNSVGMTEILLTGTINHNSTFNIDLTMHI